MLQFDSYIAKTMNPKTQTLKITNGKNIKESKNLKPKNYRKKKKSYTAYKYKKMMCYS